VTNLLLVGAGGFLGSMGRYLVSTLAYRAAGPTFPLGTLIVNVAGCFAIGVLDFLVEKQSIAPQTRLFLMTGILGGFTTFSAFGNEAMGLARGGEFRLASFNVAAHVLLGLGAVWAGRALMLALAGSKS
jgi:CrcB protein